MGKANQDSKSQPITTTSITEICERYGFGYEKKTEKDENGSENITHWATVGGESIQVEFDSDGTLPKKRRHKFIEAARKTSEDFKAAYPPAYQSPNAKKSSTASGSRSAFHPKLDDKLFRRYTLADLKEAKSVFDKVLEDMDREETARLAILGAEEEVADLETIIALSKKRNVKPSQTQKDELENAKAKLAELKSPGGAK